MIDDFAKEFSELQRRKVLAIKTLQAVLTDEADFYHREKQAGFVSKFKPLNNDLPNLLQAELDHLFSMLK